MKKNTHFILFAAGILFLLLAALAIWLGLDQHRMTSKTVSPAESEADAVLQALQGYDGRADRIVGICHRNSE